jgi:hypothetical protein
MKHTHEIYLLVRELVHFDCILLDRFVVGGIIAKFPPSWKYFSMSLKHKMETMTVESLISTPMLGRRPNPRTFLILFHRKASLSPIWWRANLVVVIRTA